MTRTLLPPSVLAAALLGVSSCRPATNLPPLYPVKGKVFHQGKPADGALVVFIPQEPLDPAATPPRAMVDPDGGFGLFTDWHEKGKHAERHEGAPPGSYVVIIEWRKPRPNAREDDDVPDSLRGRYANPKRSAFKVQVQAGDNDVPAFHLK